LLIFERMGYRRLYEDIIQQIIDNIEEKKLLIGDRLPPERDLAEQLGVSRSTLREAFRVLEQQDIIVTKPGGGRYIVGLPKQYDKQALLEDLEKAAIWDLLETRETLENRIVELACERATEQDLINIREAETFLTDSEKSSILALGDADYAFHLAVAEAAQNVVFTSFIRINLELLARIRAKTLHAPEQVAQLIREHQTIREAIEVRDKEAAKLAQTIHIRNIRKRMREAENISIKG